MINENNNKHDTCNAVLVSGCLIGLNCRYDCKLKNTRNLDKILSGKIVIPVCPEQLGGLPTPRPPQSFQGGDGYAVLAGKAKLININGEDTTIQFIKGAEEVLKIALLNGVKTVYFKQSSPACGCGNIYIGDKKASGTGVATALLLQNSIKVIPVE